MASERKATLLGGFKLGRRSSQTILSPDLGRAKTDEDIQPAPVVEELAPRRRSTTIHPTSSRIDKEAISSPIFRKKKDVVPTANGSAEVSTASPNLTSLRRKSNDAAQLGVSLGRYSGRDALKKRDGVATNATSPLGAGDDALRSGALSTAGLPKPTAPVLTAASVSELMALLVRSDPGAPELVHKFRNEFLLSLRYVLDPLALHQRIWDGIDGDGGDTEKWVALLAQWLIEHFYYFERNRALMTALVQKLGPQSAPAQRPYLTQLRAMLDRQTQTLFSSDNKRTPLDVQFLKVLLQRFVDEERADNAGDSYDNLTFTGAAALETLERSPKLITSLGDDLDSGNEQSRAYQVRKAALNVLKRLVAGGFLEVHRPNSDSARQQGNLFSDDESGPSSQRGGALASPPSSGSSSVASSPRPNGGSATSSPRQLTAQSPALAASRLAGKGPPPVPPKPATPVLPRRSETQPAGGTAAPAAEPSTPPQPHMGRSRSNSRAAPVLSPTAESAQAARAALTLSSGDTGRAAVGASLSRSGVASPPPQQPKSNAPLGPATVFSLTSSSVALLHLLLLESKAEQDERFFVAMLDTLVKDVGPKTHQGPDGNDIPNTLTGREIVDWLVGNPDKVPAELRRHEAVITEAMANQIGTKLMNSDWLIDHTSTSFMLFSLTHLYEVQQQQHNMDTGGSMAARGSRRISRAGFVRQASSNSVTPPVQLLPPSATAQSAVSANEASRDTNVDWLVEHSAADIARALTVNDVELLKQVDLTELDFQAWKKGSSDAPSTIQEWIALFNRTCYLVSTEIITCPWPEDRRSLLEKFVDVAVALRDSGNFHSMFAVVGGLTLNSTQRLTDLWSKGLDTKHQMLFAQLKAVTSSANNFKEYRTLLAAMPANTTLVPYAGLMLQDILSIEEIPLWVSKASDGAEPMLNFERLRKFAAVKLAFKQAKERCAAPPGGVDALCTYLASDGIVLDRDTLYTLSLKVQSRSAARRPRK